MSTYYLDRYAWKKPVFDQIYPGDPGLIVVIPAFNEPALLDAVNSLQACSKPHSEVLILVMINEGQCCDQEIHQVNQKTYEEVQQVRGPYPIMSGFLKLPDKKAGVGLARKIGMDEAVRIFHERNRNGVIICYDADCLCQPNFLEAVEKHFENNETHTALSFYEHPLDGENQEAILNYELYLRYYVDALRWTGFPYAFQTLGSCISVRADAYQKQGGMNTRKAGEDFYFIHKMTALGKISEINTTTIIPSDRLSDRVPFGTGHAIGQYLQYGEQEYPVYAPQTFENLRIFFSQLPTVYESREHKTGLPGSISAFLEKEGFQSKLDELISQTTDYVSFRKRFFHWMDGLKVLQLVHHSRDHYYHNIPLTEALQWLDARYFNLDVDISDKISTLKAIRDFDRKHRFYTM